MIVLCTLGGDTYAFEHLCHNCLFASGALLTSLVLPISDTRSDVALTVRRSTQPGYTSTTASSS